MIARTVGGRGRRAKGGKGRKGKSQSEDHNWRVPAGDHECAEVQTGWRGWAVDEGVWCVDGEAQISGAGWCNALYQRRAVSGTCASMRRGDTIAGRMVSRVPKMIAAARQRWIREASKACEECMVRMQGCKAVSTRVKKTMDIREAVHLRCPRRSGSGRDILCRRCGCRCRRGWSRGYYGGRDMAASM